MQFNYEASWAKLSAILGRGGAYLLLGVWTPAVRQWLQSRGPDLLCLRAQYGRACGHCPVCRAPAVIRATAILRPEEQPLGIATIRILKTQLSLRPLVGERRLVILANFETATREAQNALLKILEEPSAGLIFLLLARQQAGILATILSRVTVIELAQGKVQTPAPGLFSLADQKTEPLALRFKQLEAWLVAATPTMIEELLAAWSLALRQTAFPRRLKLLRALNHLTAQLRSRQATALKLNLEALIAQLP